MNDAKKPAADWGKVHRHISEITAALQQEMTPTPEATREILKKRARALARKPTQQDVAQNVIEVVEFMLAGECYGIEMAFVREVYPLRQLAPLPGAPPFVFGITNVRGQIISVIDLKKFFDLPDKGLTELDKILVVKHQGLEFGIRADTVSGVRQISVDELQPSLPTLTGVRGKYLQGVSAGRTIVLDMTKLFADKQIIVNEEV